MELSYSRYRENFIFNDVLGLHLDEAGHLQYEDGSYVPTICGKESLRIDKVGAYAHDEDAKQDTKLVCDHISCLVGWQRDGTDTEEWSDPRKTDFKKVVQAFNEWEAARLTTSEIAEIGDVDESAVKSVVEENDKFTVHDDEWPIQYSYDPHRE